MQPRGDDRPAERLEPPDVEGDVVVDEKDRAGAVGARVASLLGCEAAMITSGASAPDRLVREAADFFQRHGATVTKIGFVEENIHFALPAEIADAS